jgi:hypothetical protein
MDHVDDLTRAAARFNIEAGVTGPSLPTSATWPVATGVGSPAVAPCASCAG